MSYRIDVLSGKDWREYKTIRLIALQEEPQAFGSSYERESAFSEQEWKERPGNKETILLVAKDEKNLVGMVGVHFESGEKEEKSGHIWGMFVRKAYRGKGIGKMLIRDLIERVKALQAVKSVSLMVNPDQEAAISLYLSLGFNQTETKEWVLGDGKSHSLVVMGMALDSLPR